MTIPRVDWGILMVCWLYLWATGLQDLAVRPRVYEDEPWIASPGYGLWERGEYGSELLQGFYGMERHYLAFMPLYSLISGVWLYLASLGLFQARLLMLYCALLILALTYRLARRVWSPTAGVAALVILVSWPLASPTPHFQAGIPLADWARIARYDLATALFGLAAILTALGRPSPSKGLLSGGLGGLATLCHAYGLFYLAGVVLITPRRWWGWIGLGVGLMLLPSVGYSLAHWDDYQAQNRPFGDRLPTLAPEFYWDSLQDEPERYRPLWEQAGQITYLALGLAALGLAALYRKGGAGRALLAIIALLMGLLAGLVNYKTYSYVALVWPLWAILAGAGVAALWHGLGQQRWFQIGLAVLLLLPSIVGGQRQADLHQQAQQMTPYSDFTAQLTQVIPPDADLLAMQHYWFGLAAQTASYRSWLVPIFWANPAYVTDPRPLADVLAQTPPDVILLDEVMLHFLRSAARPDDPFHPLYQQIMAYLQPMRLIAEWYDPTYGAVKVYQRDSS
jgi:hypothetical protein